MARSAERDRETERVTHTHAFTLTQKHSRKRPQTAAVRAQGLVLGGKQASGYPSMGQGVSPASSGHPRRLQLVAMLNNTLSQSPPGLRLPHYATPLEPWGVAPPTCHSPGLSPPRLNTLSLGFGRQGLDHFEWFWQVVLLAKVQELWVYFPLAEYKSGQGLPSLLAQTIPFPVG